jgi:hypothetical protein
MANSAVDLIVSSVSAEGLSEKQWDLIEEAVGAIDGSSTSKETSVGKDGALNEGIDAETSGGAEKLGGLEGPIKKNGRIVICWP